LFTLLPSLVLFFAACNTHPSISEQIGAQLRSGASEIDMRQFGGSDWDHVFVFGPYSGKQEICTAIGITENDCSRAGIRNLDEGESLLILMQARTLAAAERLPRSTANFDDACLAKNIPRSKALFIVNRTSNVYLMCR